MFIAADADEDFNLTRDEFTGLAKIWFAKLDPANSGKVSQDQFVSALQELIPANGGMRPPRRDGDETERRGGGPPRGGFGPGQLLGPGLFQAFDVDKSAEVTQKEIEQQFSSWYEQWAEGRTAISEDELRDGLSTVLPQPNFGAGGPGGLGSGGRGPGGPGGGPPGGMDGSWSTPILVDAGDREELIVAFAGRVVAYDPSTGKQLWASKGLGERVYATPVNDGSTIVVMSGGMSGGVGVAVKAGGAGDVTDTQRIWRAERTENLMGSGVIHDDHLYVVSQDGIAACLDIQTGDRVWKKRLRGSSSQGSVWSSMLLSGDRIFIPNQSGDVFVLAASPKYKLLATNSVGEPTNASLAASDGELFMRTDAALWCIGGKP